LPSALASQYVGIRAKDNDGIFKKQVEPGAICIESLDLKYQDAVMYGNFFCAEYNCRCEAVFGLIVKEL
jgi:hypothetical protein